MVFEEITDILQLRGKTEAIETQRKGRWVGCLQTKRMINAADVPVETEEGAGKMT